MALPLAGDGLSPIARRGSRQTPRRPARRPRRRCRRHRIMMDRKAGDLIGKPDRANKGESIAAAERQRGNSGESRERHGASKAEAEDGTRQNKQSNPERLAPRGRGRVLCHSPYSLLIRIESFMGNRPRYQIHASQQGGSQGFSPLITQAWRRGAQLSSCLPRSGYHRLFGDSRRSRPRYRRP